MKNIFTHLLRKQSIFFFLFSILSPIFLHAQISPAPDTATSSGNIAFNIGTGTDGSLFSTAIQADGKVIIGGEFTSFNGISINSLARLNVNGTLDNTFNIGTGTERYHSVNSIAIQTDGKIIIGGAFSFFNGDSTNCIARLNANGTLDNTFNIGSGPNDSSIYMHDVNSIAIQTNGKIIIGGDFATFNGISKNRLVRLNADGSIDSTFNIGTGVDGGVSSIVIQADGKIIIGGNFTSFNGVSTNNIARINTDGSLDNTFNIGTGADVYIESMAIQANGKIIIGGWFTSFNSIPINGIARLNVDGSLDNTFNIGTGTDGYADVHSIAIQTDGKIIIGGSFTYFNGIPINHLARLNTDGTLDNTFNMGTGLNSDVWSIAIQADEKIIIGGWFTSYQSLPYNYIVRLCSDNVHYNNIRGIIYTDSNNDCKFQLSENSIPSLVVKAQPGPYYGMSDAYGGYQIKVDSGKVNYTLTQEYNSINSKLLVNQCTTSQTVSLTGVSKDTCCFNFADSTGQCSLLNISIQKTSARQCIRGATYVNYTNYGSLSTTGAVVKIYYPSHIFPIASSPMWTSKQGSVLTYNIGIIQAGQSRRIIITDSVSCINGIGDQTECIRATISPSTDCVANNPAWDNSSMTVIGTCVSDSAHFIITNAGTGDMGSALQYRVYENDTLVYTGTYQLKSGERFTVDYPAQGQSIRLEADQSPLHPGNSQPRATVENCGTPSSGTATTGLVTTASLDDRDEEVAMTCPMITNSHDPNEKSAIPSGTGSAHNIAPGEEIEYVIGFQNTGNDTAYTVTVVDTLDAALDVASFIQGASSHPYTLNISGKGRAVLTFKFNNINLPDSTTNLLASSGLVSYRITVPSGATTGTVIKNKAYIYFDYNKPVITNETTHTVDSTVPSDMSKGSAVRVGVTTGLASKRSSLAVKIYPNPTNGMVTLEMPESASVSEMRVYSVIGVLQKTVTLDKSATQQVNLEDIQEGLYLYEILQNGERKAGGMLKIK
jgi:uncharacterized delta-60 repeat protein/uncharacterized repeat protein (TIGR01451 family)